jgi:glycosyltransferase involved in cell wall biosynthesis
VRFFGFVPDATLSVLYRLASVFVFPSLYEGFGLPPLEAMASGTPVVTSNVSSLPEVAGDAAVLVDPYDPEAIADGIYRVLTDEGLRHDLRQKGLNRARQFSWEDSARRVRAIYQQAGGAPAAAGPWMEAPQAAAAARSAPPGDGAAARDGGRREER